MSSSENFFRIARKSCLKNCLKQKIGREISGDLQKKQVREKESSGNESRTEGKQTGNLSPAERKLPAWTHDFTSSHLLLPLPDTPSLRNLDLAKFCPWHPSIPELKLLQSLLHED